MSAKNLKNKSESNEQSSQLYVNKAENKSENKAENKSENKAENKSENKAENKTGKASSDCKNSKNCK